MKEAIQRIAEGPGGGRQSFLAGVLLDAIQLGMSLSSPGPPDAGACFRHPAYHQRKHCLRGQLDASSAIFRDRSSFGSQLFGRTIDSYT
ncbi:hypothetical protein BZM26_36775 [Paraburkholderia strydomiana]|nr:hypothetical protein BZM26_36775 [Paraburkholderia strydomiana]